MILEDELPQAANERTDRNIRDARGSTVESGIRRTFATGLSYDVGAFGMHYANRLGLLTLTDSAGAPYTLKANVGTTRTLGLEARLGLPLGTAAGAAWRAFGAAWRAFGAASSIDARYVRGSIVSATTNVDVRNNEVESAPRWIVRSGLSATRERVSSSVQVSHVARTCADALSTVTPSAN